MKFELLADNPDVIPKVARWYLDEWGSVAGESMEDSIARVASCSGRETAPLMVLAKADDKASDEVVGAAQFKLREMDIYPDYEFWLGGVYVDGGARGRGVASGLVREVLARARAAGVERLYLQTEELSGGLYLRSGFEPLEEVDYKGHRVLVMVAAPLE